MDISYLLLLQYLRELTGGIANSFFMFITDLGSSVLPFLVLAGMYWCIDKQIGEYMMLNTFFGDWINGVVKITACVYRPWIRSDMIHPVDEARLTATGYSFPSGHTTQAVAVWGGMAVSYRKEKLLRNGLIGLIILIAFSEITLEYIHHRMYWWQQL